MIQDKDRVSSNRERRYLRTNPTGAFRLNLTKFEHRRVIFKNLSKIMNRTSRVIQLISKIEMATPEIS